MTELHYEVIGTDSIVTAIARDGALWLTPDDFAESTGWKVRDIGLCRDTSCVPIAHLPALRDGELVDLVGVATLLAAPLVVDDDERLAAIGTTAAIRSAELADDRAAEVTLRDLDGRPTPLLNESASKQMVVAFSSWCGCRYDLPGWQRLHDELSPHGFEVVAVAVDESPDDVRPWVEDLDIPVLLDTDRTFCDRYGVVNVPTVVWIDEERRIVQPNLQAFSDDQFKEFHGKESEPHAQALRSWVVDGVTPVPDAQLGDHRPDATERGQLARTEFRLSLELRRRGRVESADEHQRRATELAPDDFTIWRAGLALSGLDPFGDRFFEQYEEWKQRTGGHSYPSDRQVARDS